MTYSSLLHLKKSGIKSLIILIDPDKLTPYQAIKIAESAKSSGAIAIFIGGSLLVTQEFDMYVQQIKAAFGGTVILFPGSVYQISKHADALLFLSVISGRNPEMLIGRHVIAAPMLKQSKIEIISTGYLLIDGGEMTTVEYMSGTTPIPHHKPDIAACTAMAGEMLGLNLIYMDAGSGAKNPISTEMVNAVSKQVSVPVIIGGGIKKPETAIDLCKAGADIIVIGNATEQDPGIIAEISSAIHSLNY